VKNAHVYIFLCVYVYLMFNIYIYIYIYIYIHTYIPSYCMYVCLRISGNELPVFLFFVCFDFCESWHFGIKRLVFQLRLLLEILIFYLEVLGLVF
jgi:hypothetical protein